MLSRFVSSLRCSAVLGVTVWIGEKSPMCFEQDGISKTCIGLYSSVENTSGLLPKMRLPIPLGLEVAPAFNLQPRRAFCGKEFLHAVIQFNCTSVGRQRRVNAKEG